VNIDSEASGTVAGRSAFLAIESSKESDDASYGPGLWRVGMEAGYLFGTAVMTISSTLTFHHTQKHYRPSDQT
jgi:hypothetical protein